MPYDRHLHPSRSSISTSADVCAQTVGATLHTPTPPPPPQPTWARALGKHRRYCLQSACQENVLWHQLTHTGKKSCWCCDWGRCFRQRLPWPFTAAHTQARNVLPAVGICFYSSLLLSQGRIHSDETPSPCTESGERFKREYALKANQWIHQTNRERQRCGRAG